MISFLYHKNKKCWDIIKVKISGRYYIRPQDLIDSNYSTMITYCFHAGINVFLIDLEFNSVFEAKINLILSWIVWVVKLCLFQFLIHNSTSCCFSNIHIAILKAIFKWPTMHVYSYFKTDCPSKHQALTSHRSRDDG